MFFTGGITDIIGQILDICSEQQLSVVFAMSRRRLALVLKKRHKIGCVGIFSYDGAEVSNICTILVLLSLDMIP